jgi:hypothetical protein
MRQGNFERILKIKIHEKNIKMDLIDLELNNLRIESKFQELNNSHMTKLYIDENNNLIFKIYFFPRYLDENLCKEEFFILEQDVIIYKFLGTNLTRQTETKFEKNIIKKNKLHIYFINLYKCDFLHAETEIKKEKINLIQTHESIENVPRELLFYNLEMNSNFNYYFFNSHARRRFIKQNYDVKHLNAFDLLIPGAYRADLFRLLSLNELGGIYMDHKCVLNVTLKEIITNKYYLTNDIKKKTIYNGFLVFEKKSKILIRLINLFINKISNRHIHKIDAHEFGPNFFREYIDFGDKYMNFNHILLKHDEICPYVANHDKTKLILFNGYHDYNYRGHNSQYYYNLFINNQVYFEKKNISKKKNYIFYLWKHYYSDNFDFDIINNNLYIERLDKQEGFTFNHILKIVNTCTNKERLVEIGPSETFTKVICNVF